MKLVFNRGGPGVAMRAEVTQDGEVDLPAAERVHRAVRPGPAADRRAPRVLQIRLDGHVHPRDGQLRP